MTSVEDITPQGMDYSVQLLFTCNKAQFSQRANKKCIGPTKENLLNNNFHIKQYKTMHWTVISISRHSLRVRVDIYPSEAQVFRCLQGKTSLAAVQYTDELENWQHQLLTADRLKHLSSYTGCSSLWISAVLRPLAPKNQIAARCSFLDANSGTLSMFIVYRKCS